MRKVCEVYLVSSASSDERGVELTFPVSQYEMMDAFEQIHTKSPGDVYWQVDEFYCFDYLAPHLDESMSIFEFNSLTEQLSKLDERQETALEGLLQMQVKNHMQENSGIITVPELMMLAHNVDHCHVLADVHTDTELGKFCADNDFLPELTALPDSVYALLDYAKIGKQMREDEAGVFTPHGYVVRTEELQPLPDYEPQRDINYMIRLTLMNHENEQKTAVLDLPATEERLLEVQKELDAPEWYDAQFTGCDTIAPQLNTLLTDVEDLPRINELAQALQELKASGQLTKFKAVVSATQCESLDDVFDRLEKLSQYCFEAKIRDRDALVRDELEFVLGGKDADLIYKHLNCEAYAEDVLKQYGAEITPYGMVNREDFGPLHEPISEQQQEQTQEPQMGM
ncbi:MAG: antirestriction protein ArdA [Oscillospiraceae bacterium]